MLLLSLITATWRANVLSISSSLLWLTDTLASLTRAHCNSHKMSVSVTLYTSQISQHMTYMPRSTCRKYQANYHSHTRHAVHVVSMQGRRSHRSWGVMTPHFSRQRGTGGHNLGIIHMHCYLFLIKHTAHYKHTMSILVFKSFHAINVSHVFILKH